MTPSAFGSHCFNPVLGFLSVSTSISPIFSDESDGFQSRAGFSECLDLRLPVIPSARPSFNPVLGFLSVSTPQIPDVRRVGLGFNPVLGFLSVSTSSIGDRSVSWDLFQSRAGFSECLDLPRRS